MQRPQFLLMTMTLFFMLVSHFTIAQTIDTAKNWISLFNGKDIQDWFVKIHHHVTGDNYGNTFRVEDGILKVRYDQYDKFNDRFGHLSYKTPFSYYRMANY